MRQLAAEVVELLCCAVLTRRGQGTVVGVPKITNGLGRRPRCVGVASASVRANRVGARGHPWTTPRVHGTVTVEPATTKWQAPAP